MDRKRPRGPVVRPQEYLQKTVNRIMVVLGSGADGSESALRYAAGLSQMCGASVLLLYPMEIPLAFPADPVVPGVVPLMPSTLWDSIEDQGKAALEEAIAGIASLGVRAEGMMIQVTGGFAAAVSRVASEDSDLLIVSRAEPRGLDRLLGGDYAVELVRHAKCPVVVVRS
jgi:nucleotide-binding universal stress UspA family protein